MKEPLNEPAGSVSRIDFHLLQFAQSDDVARSTFLLPQGTLYFQRIGFPRDLDRHTCIPKGPIFYFISVMGRKKVEFHPFYPAEPLTETDIPAGEVLSRVKGYLCHKRRSEPDQYRITALYVDGVEIHWAGFIGKRIVFRRLGHEVAIDLSQFPDTHTFSLSLEWDVNHIEVRASWLSGTRISRESEFVALTPKTLDSYRPPTCGTGDGRKARKDFSVQLAPVHLSRPVWQADRPSISDKNPDGSGKHGTNVPRNVYVNESDFLQAVMDVLAEVRRILSEMKPYAFWNAGASPKDEPECGATLAVFIEQLCESKNIAVSQEVPSRSGKVDFLFMGISESGHHLKLLLEMKRAHSDRLEAGLTKQLPKYLQEHAVNIGVYAVLWFKCSRFNDPAKFDENGILAHLGAMRPPNVADIVLFDLSFPIAASKL